MKRLSRDAWLAIGLFIALAIVAIIAAVQETRSKAIDPALASHSNAPNGARALTLWLNEIGYHTTAAVAPTFQIPKPASIVMLLEPWTGISNSEFDTLDAWVDKGGTLIIVGTGFGAMQTMQHYDFSLNASAHPTQTVTIETPLFASPVIAELGDLNGRFTLQSSRTDFVTHAALAGQPVVVSLPKGDGQVILSSWIRPFSNIGLQEKGNPELVLNMLSSDGTPGTVWFDEWHHGVRPEGEAITASNWLQRTPAGRSLIYVAVLIFVALVLRGQLFGRPVPRPKDITRRAPLEHITAVANLSRRAGHRTAVLQDYHQRLKRHLGHRYRLSPTLPDATFLQQLATFQPDLDINQLTHLMQRLTQPKISESDMVQLAAETAKWLEK